MPGTRDTVESGKGVTRMEITEIVSTIFQYGGGVAFPIVMCLILFKYIKEEQAQTRDLITDLKSAIVELTYKVAQRYNLPDD